MRALSSRLWEVIEKETPSIFMDRAAENWHCLGCARSQSVAHDMDSFHLEQPGYYGLKGFGIIYSILHKIFLRTYIHNTRQMAHPLTPDYILRKVLIPEAALGLIAQDLLKPVDDPVVMKTLEDSRSFGVAMFPDDE